MGWTCGMPPESDPFIQRLRERCKHDHIMTKLINNTISWGDVPSDEENPMELEGWRAYKKVEEQARAAYRRTVRHQKQVPHRVTVKQPVWEKKPYAILRQERIQ